MTGALTYTWLDNGSVVGSGTTYTPQSTDAGNSLDVVIGFINGNTTEQITELAGKVAAPPAVSVGATNPVTTNEGAALPLSNLGVTFADAGGDTITATLNLAANGDTAHGTLTLGASSSATSVDGATVSDNGSADVTLTGTITEVDNALATVTYTPNTGFLGTDTLTFSATDTATGGAFASNTATLGITVVPDHWTASGGGDWNTPADWNRDSAPTAGAAAIVDASGTYTVTIDSADAALSLLLNDSGATVSELAGGSLTLGSGLTVDPGAFTQTSGATLTAASVNIASGSANFDGGINVSGLFETTGGALVIGPDATFTQSNATVTIAGGGTAEFDYGGNGTQPLTVNAAFTGAGTLQLDHAAEIYLSQTNQTVSPYTGTISGFGPGDTIRLMDEPASGLTPTWDQSTGTLTIDSFGTGTLVDLQLTGTYNSSFNSQINDFRLVADPTATVTVDGFTYPVTDLVWGGPDTTKSTISVAATTVGAGAETVLMTVEDSTAIPLRAFQWCRH